MDIVIEKNVIIGTIALRIELRNTRNDKHLSILVSSTCGMTNFA